MNNYFRISVIFILILFCHTNGSAVTKKQPGLPYDTAKFEVIYRHVSKDPVWGTTRLREEMLFIGDSIMRYGGYVDFKVDSIVQENKKSGIEISVEERVKLDRELGSGLSEYMYTNSNKGEIDFYGYMMANLYKYSEPIPEFDWSLTEETENILGYECTKATTKWRGREWNVWFCDIPVDGGPWKFSGLPGLILKVEDSEGYHSIQAIETRKDILPIKRAPTFIVKTDRKKYNRLFEESRVNAGEMLINSGMVKMTEEQKKEMRKRRLFYSPIELE